MKIGRKNNLFSIKYLILLLIIVTTIFVCFYIKQGINNQDKWISISELQDSTTFEDMNGGYIYCNSYNNIKNQKLRTATIILSFSCVVVGLGLYLILLSKKLNREECNRMMIKSSNTKEKTTEIITKYSYDEFEVKIKQILNDDFRNNLFNKFCNLQVACMNSDYKLLQSLLTTELYNKYCTGLVTLKSKARKNIVDDFELISIKYNDIKQDNYKYTVEVYLKVKYYGYTIDTETNEIVKGVKYEKIVNTYMLKLIKYKNNIKCPNCSAPLQSNFTICDYCKTKIKEKTNDWLISEKEKVNEN